MIIVIWALVIICIVIVCGEIKYRYFDMKEVKKENKIISKDWKDNMDYDFCDLSIEGTSNDMVSQQVLAMRGSWRLAQRQVMNEQSFMVLKQEEYRKKL